MIGSNDILQTIITQSAKGYNSWQIEPMWVAIENNEKEINRPELLPDLAPVGSHTFREVSKIVELNNDILILTNAELDIPISATLCLESHDNIFTITKAEYTVLSFHKYQSFSNYLKITLKNYGNYVPFQLEFLRIKPCLDTSLASPPFGNANGHFQNRNRSCEKDDD